MLQQLHGPGGHVWARSCLTRDSETGESVCRLSRCVNKLRRHQCSLTCQGVRDLLEHILLQEHKTGPQLQQGSSAWVKQFDQAHSSHPGAQRPPVAIGQPGSWADEYAQNSSLQPPLQGPSPATGAAWAEQYTASSAPGAAWAQEFTEAKVQVPHSIHCTRRHAHTLRRCQLCTVAVNSLWSSSAIYC